MNKKLIISFFALAFLTSCNKNKEILDTLNDYNTSMETKGYHFGDKITLPSEVTNIAENITISFGDKETSSLTIDTQYFTLGDNAVTFNIKMKNGKTLNQDATINVFAKNPEIMLNYEVVKEYPHSIKSFTEGFFFDDDIIYESAGKEGESKLMKYALGSLNPVAETKQPDDIFSEGIAAVGNKIFQLTWQNKKGFIYDKNSLKLLGEFPYPNILGEGWGMTTDGKNLIVSDGSKNIYFLDPNDPSKVVKTISVAGKNEVYDQLNELEYHNGFLYSNVWQKPIVLKINSQTGEVVGKFDFSKIVSEHTKGDDDVLNGIAFKGDNMLITGKNWNTIYEIAIK
jgi:glutamine cyclotransferase